MGRLGFNFMRPKEASKDAEGGEPDQQNEQNEKNENVEICELLLTIEQRNRTIKTLRLMLMTLTTVIITACGFIALMQSRVFHSEQAAAWNMNKLEAYTQQFDALQGQYDAVLDAVKLEREKNCTREASASLEKLERLLSIEKSLREKENAEANEKYSNLRESFETLQTEHESLSGHCLKKEEDLQAEIKRSQEERAELIGKLEEANRKLVRSQRQLAPRTTTTTPAPSRNLFDPERLKKFNDLVKEIETGSAIFDFNGFMKKTDEVFRP